MAERQHLTTDALKPTVKPKQQTPVEVSKSRAGQESSSDPANAGKSRSSRDTSVAILSGSPPCSEDTSAGGIVSPETGCDKLAPISHQIATRSVTGRLNKRLRSYSPPKSPPPVKKTVREVSKTVAPVVVTQEVPSVVTTQSTPEAKTRKQWEQWSVQDKNYFFEALCEYGKDFEAIQSWISQKLKRRDPNCGVRTKDHIRHFYYRTWHKICRHIDVEGMDASDINKQSLELYGLINYGELRKRIGKLDEKNGQKLNELVHKGATSVKYKSKNHRIKTPVCRALKKLHHIEDQKEEEKSKMPERVTVELFPHSNLAWTHVQAASHNPRLKVTLKMHKKLTSLLDLLNKRWTKGARRAVREGRDEKGNVYSSELKLHIPESCCVVPLNLRHVPSQSKLEFSFNSYLESQKGLECSTQNAGKFSIFNNFPALQIQQPARRQSDNSLPHCVEEGTKTSDSHGTPPSPAVAKPVTDEGLSAEGLSDAEDFYDLEGEESGGEECDDDDPDADPDDPEDDDDGEPDDDLDDEEEDEDWNNTTKVSPGKEGHSDLNNSSVSKVSQTDKLEASSSSQSSPLNSKIPGSSSQGQSVHIQLTAVTNCISQTSSEAKSKKQDASEVQQTCGRDSLPVKELPVVVKSVMEISDAVKAASETICEKASVSECFRELVCDDVTVEAMTRASPGKFKTSPVLTKSSESTSAKVRKQRPRGVLKLAMTKKYKNVRTKSVIQKTALSIKKRLLRVYASIQNNPKQVQVSSRRRRNTVRLFRKCGKNAASARPAVRRADSVAPNRSRSNSKTSKCLQHRDSSNKTESTCQRVCEDCVCPSLRDFLCMNKKCPEHRPLARSADSNNSQEGTHDNSSSPSLADKHSEKCDTHDNRTACGKIHYCLCGAKKSKKTKLAEPLKNGCRLGLVGAKGSSQPRRPGVHKKSCDSFSESSCGADLTLSSAKPVDSTGLLDSKAGSAPLSSRKRLELSASLKLIEADADESLPRSIIAPSLQCSPDNSSHSCDTTGVSQSLAKEECLPNPTVSSESPTHASPQSSCHSGDVQSPTEPSTKPAAASSSGTHPPVEASKGASGDSKCGSMNRPHQGDKEREGEKAPSKESSLVRSSASRKCTAEKLAKLQRGLLQRDCENLTVAELFLMLGRPKTLVLEYEFVRKTEVIKDSGIWELNKEINNMLRRLVHLATTEFTDKEKVKAPLSVLSPSGCRCVCGLRRDSTPPSCKRLGLGMSPETSFSSPSSHTGSLHNPGTPSGSDPRTPHRAGSLRSHHGTPPTPKTTKGLRPAELGDNSLELDPLSTAADQSAIFKLPKAMPPRIQQIRPASRQASSGINNNNINTATLTSSDIVAPRRTSQRRMQRSVRRPLIVQRTLLPKAELPTHQIMTLTMVHSGMSASGAAQTASFLPVESAAQTNVEVQASGSAPQVQTVPATQTQTVPNSQTPTLSTQAVTAPLTQTRKVPAHTPRAVVPIAPKVDLGVTPGSSAGAMTSFVITSTPSSCLAANLPQRADVAGSDGLTAMTGTSADAEKPQRSMSADSTAELLPGREVLRGSLATDSVLEKSVSLETPSISSLLNISLPSADMGESTEKFLDLALMSSSGNFGGLADKEASLSSLLNEQSSLAVSQADNLKGLSDALTEQWVHSEQYSLCSFLREADKRQRATLGGASGTDTLMDASAPDTNSTATPTLLSSFSANRTPATPQRLFTVGEGSANQMPAPQQVFLIGENSRDSSILGKNDVDTTLQAMMNENSMEYMSKFADLAEQMDSGNMRNFTPRKRADTTDQ